MLAALLLAAGAAMRAGEDKALADLGGVPLVRWAAARLAADPRVGLLVVAARADGHRAMAQALLGIGRPEIRIVSGGATRADSVRAALGAVGAAERVLVHDGARPFLDAATLARVVEGLEAHGAAAAALPVADTLRRGGEPRPPRDRLSPDRQDDPAADGGRAAALGWAGETIERAGLYAMQTPQAFARDALVAAYQVARGDPTDCAAAVLANGGRVRLVPGHPLNFKVTTAEDLSFARALVAAGVVRVASAMAPAARRGG